MPRRSLAEVIPEEMPLAGYLLARALQDRKVDGEDFERLRRANDSVREVRALLPFGRGNMREDIRASRGESSTRTKGGRDLRRDPVHAPEDVAAIWAGAGNCGEHARLCTRAHAARLDSQSGESVIHYHNAQVDHSWVEALVPRSFNPTIYRWKPEPRDIVLDAWKDGPAVFGPDSTSTWSDWERARTIRHWSYQPQGLSTAKALAQNLARTHDPRDSAPYITPEWSVWDAEPVVGKAFLANASQKPVPATAVWLRVHHMVPQPKRLLAAMPSEIRRQILAVGIARELMAPPAPQIESTHRGRGRVRTATNQARDIVDAMKNLRHPAPRGGAPAPGAEI
ncbi:MAG TPA: hypothetical protein VFP68_22165 [Burkholderiaceae bacterium]|nr:hypothetical protein [Burkholderiaceae bacterium]